MSHDVEIYVTILTIRFYGNYQKKYPNIYIYRIISIQEMYYTHLVHG